MRPLRPRRGVCQRRRRTPGAGVRRPRRIRRVVSIALGLTVGRRWRCPMAGDDAALATAVQDGMGGDDATLLEDANLVGHAVHFDRATAHGVRHAVEIAVHGHHAVTGDAPLQPQHRLEGSGRQRLQAGAFLGEVLADHAACGGVNAGIGDLVEPLAELVVEVGQVAKAAAEEEVLADVAKRAFHLAFCFRPIGLTGLGQVAVVAGELDQGAVVDDVAGLWVLAHEHGAHAVVEDLGRHAAQRFEGCGVAAQQGLQVLVGHEPAPQHAAMTQHQRKQPDHPLGAGFVGEHGAEMREVDLGLPARWRFEAHLERRRRNRPDLAQQIGHRRVATAITNRGQLAVQAAAGQLGDCAEPLSQIRLERLKLGDPGLPRAIGRRLEAAGDDLAHRLAVQPSAARNGRYAGTLPM
jgi:hypothetical protein